MCMYGGVGGLERERERVCMCSLSVCVFTSQFHGLHSVYWM